MITSEFSSYKLDDSVASELHNNIVLVDKIVSNKGISAKPQFFILGGAALVLHNLNYKSTLDIDTANKIEQSIREEVSFFMDDGASEVTSLGMRYKERAQRYYPDDLKSIEVYLLSLEDLLLTKLYSARRKDLRTIQTCGILKQADLIKAKDILYTEYYKSHKEHIIQAAKMIGIDWS